MFQPNGSTIECATCVASNTSACSECIVNYVLANDAGPIEYVPSPEPVDIRPSGAGEIDDRVSPAAAIDRAVELFVRAGLVDEPVEFVSLAEFERGVVGAPLAGATRQ